MRQRVLVTGGAGYIGSHVVKQLGEQGYEVVVYDNCSTGSPESVLYGELIQAEISDLDTLRKTFAKYDFQAVLHFAASLIAPESVVNPLAYYRNNTCNTLNVLTCCRDYGVNQLVFSSTAAVYGQPNENPVLETTPTVPINPYGRSKLMSEWMIQDLAKISPFQYVILRYFNVAGAHPDGKIGQNNPNASHLIRIACDAVLGQRSAVEIFGTDFPTPDGTGIRDYIHVEDLASAHLDALHYLEGQNESQIFNCGYGQGYSVREVLDRVQAISGVNFPILESGRRAGDPAEVIACADKIATVLGWQPQFNDLHLIIKTTLDWERKRTSNSVTR
jgi:UDP-glucose 4-epimerase